MRRLLAAAAVAAIGFSLTVPPASAHYNDNKYAADRHTVAWQNTDNPSPSTTASDGAQVWMDEVVAAYANFADGIQSWDVVARPVNGGQPSTCHENLDQNPNTKGFPTEVYINCPWNTTMATEHTLDGKTSADVAKQPISSRVWRSRDLGPAVNGKYTIEITINNAGQSCGLITGCSRDQSKVVEPHLLYQPDTNPPRWREVYVVNEAAAPTGVTSDFDAANNQIFVTWAANPEPDATYIVQEKVGDGKWSGGVGVPANRYTRTLDQPGKYQYRVAAVRPAPTRDKGDATKRSDYIAASTVDVAQITPPATAGAAPNGADGASGGGDPGVFVPTDPNSPTPATAGAKKPSKGSTSSRPGGSSARPAGSSSRPAGSTAQPGEAEGEGIDEGFSPELPYNTNQTQGGLEEDDGLNEEASPSTLGGGVVPRPRDTRGLLIYMAGALTLFVFAMQLTVLLRRSRPVLAGATPEQYSDDFDDWLGGF
jgi:hypothetical protein